MKNSQGNTKRVVSKTSLAAVCPMANEEANAAEFVERMLAAMTPFQQSKLYVVLDNACKDNTRQILEQIANDESRLEVVWAPQNRNVVDAYFNGYKAALADPTWDMVLEIDAGFSHLPEELERFYPDIEAGKDCVFGSRFTNRTDYDRSADRRKISQLGTLLTKFFIGSRMTDLTSGYQLFSRETLTAIVAHGVQSQAHFFQTEIKILCRKLDWAEVPITYTPTADAVSRKAITNSLQVLRDLFFDRLTGKLAAIEPAELQ